MDVDLDKITGAGLNTVTPVLICNTDDYEKISLKKEGEVSLDEAFSVFPDLFLIFRQMNLHPLLL